MLDQGSYIDPINLPPLPPGKTEIDVAADYLFHVRQAVRADLQKILGNVFTSIERNIQWCFTMPIAFGELSKAAFRNAIIQAGYLRDQYDNRLTLTPEPEAVALYGSKYGLITQGLGDVVLIVDAGGGVVDLISYEVDDVTQLNFRKLTAATGDSCG
jgi:hypothetical protein